MFRYKLKQPIKLVFILVYCAASLTSNAAEKLDLKSTSTNSQSPNWHGLKNDSYLILGYQLAAVGVIYFLPKKISGWNDKDRETTYRISKYSTNIQDIHWDHDRWFVNYVGHPYFGAAYFVVARNHDFNKAQSFWYATAMSAIFEYGIEAFFEVPSIQDLVVTPLAGVLVGEYFFQFNKKLTQRVLKKGEGSWVERSLLFATNPIGSLNRNVRQWAGKNVEVNVLPYMNYYQNLKHQNQSVISNIGAVNAEFGLKIMFQW